MVFRARTNRQGCRTEIGRQRYREGPFKGLVSTASAGGRCGRRSGLRFFHSRRAPGHAAFPDELQQMMIGYMLDLIRQNYEQPIDFVEFPAFEVISQVLAAQAERVPPRMLAQNELGIRDPY